MAPFKSSPSEKASEKNPVSPSTSPFLPLRYIDIEDYTRGIILNASSTSEGQDQLAQHVVWKLEHMKDGGRAQHEHVIAYVTDHNKNEVRLSIERSKGQDNAAPNDKNHSHRAPRSSTGTITSSSIPNSSQDSILKPSPAMDIVKNIGQMQFPGSRVLTIFEPDPPIPLLQLVITIESIHHRNTFYTMLRNQCYWFATLIMNISMTLGGTGEFFPVKGKVGAKPEVKHLRRIQLSDTDIDSSGLSEIPIYPGPEAEPHETVGELGTIVGMHKGIPIVAVSPVEIREAALESQRRYECTLHELATKKSERVSADEALKQLAAAQAETATAQAEIAALRRQLAAQRDM
ncbi:hypothetical protein BDN70DRAFT_888022 [Pholiota conissans]|uniref:Uncharacterized protein n=1 Tax=Pholiota conissans TaxID=109636 RepID=A0A9P6CSY0_9AGAR|nr:hypothetical protein BDN70DRAFT_888022 [Pholiota conissans]